MVVQDTLRKNLVEDVFDKAAEGYIKNEYMLEYGKRLVAAAHIRSGDSVLDIATGRGAVLIPAAQAVGPSGLAVGIDLSQQMVDHTTADLRKMGLPYARVHQMDAESLSFKDSMFDAVTCGFGIMYFPDLDRALAEVRRVLKPGGRIAVSTWGEDDPRWGWYDDLLKAHIVRVRSWALDERDEVRATLAGAGFKSIEVVTEDFDCIYPDENQWWALQQSLSLRATYDLMAPNVRSQVKAEAFAHLRALKQADGIHRMLHANIATAVRAQ